LQVHQELCQDNHVFYKAFEKSFETCEWDEACIEAFETLKGILIKTPMLKFPTLTRILRSIPMLLTL
jgi:hypothetical protein